MRVKVATGKLALAVDEYEKYFADVHDYDLSQLPVEVARAPTGEFYFELVVQRHNTAWKAIKDWELRAYNLLPMALGKDRKYHFTKTKATLYWRIRPEIDYISKKGWAVYSRFLISDLPRKKGKRVKGLK